MKNLSMNKTQNNISQAELEQTIKDNFGLIVSQALLFNPPSKDELDEYIQIGSLAMMRAVKNFDAAKGAQFSTFACNCISNAIKNYIKKNSKKLDVTSTPTEYNVTASFEELIPDTLTDIESKLINLKLANYSIKEIAAETGFSVVKVRNILSKAYTKIREANEENTNGK